MDSSEPPRHQPIETTPIFRMFEEVSRWAWNCSKGWDYFAKDTIGKQIVRSLDSVNANIVEADGRYSSLDAIKHLVIARGSAREGRLWIERAKDRKLVDGAEADSRLAQIDEATRQLNLLINYRRKFASLGQVREEVDPYYGEQMNREAVK